MPASFFDPNVLLYIASGDPARADRVEALVSEGGAISVQVLNEIAKCCASQNADAMAGNPYFPIYAARPADGSPDHDRDT
jgi:predicted nucleic acid-binding protein